MNIRASLKQFLFGALFFFRVPALARFLNRRKVTILMFHGFTDRDHDGTENYDRKHLHIARLEEFLAYLVRHHQVVPLESVVKHCAEGAPLPHNPAVLSFDDGYASNYHLAFPLLKKYGVHATIFLATDFVHSKKWLWADRLEYAFGRTTRPSFQGEVAGEKLSLPLAGRAERMAAVTRVKRRLKAAAQEILEAEIRAVEMALGVSLGQAPSIPALYGSLDWGQVREMLESGLVSVGGHTHSHLILSRCRQETVEWELRTCREIIERETGHPCRLFCYPNGGKGDYTVETRQALRQADFRCALTTRLGFNGPRSDVYELRRFGIPDRLDYRYFVLVTSGVLPFIWTLRRRLKRMLRFGRKSAVRYEPDFVVAD